LTHPSWKANRWAPKQSYLRHFVRVRTLLLRRGRQGPFWRFIAKSETLVVRGYRSRPSDTGLRVGARGNG
jgi:hypothetical protein